MKKSTKGPTAKKGTVLGHDYFEIQELPDPESHLSEEQKKWPRSDLVIGSSELPATPPEVQEREPNPKPPPTA